MGERGSSGSRGMPAPNGVARGHVALRHLKRPVVLGAFFLVGFVVGLVDLDRSRTPSPLTPSSPLHIEYHKHQDKRTPHPSEAVGDNGLGANVSRGGLEGKPEEDEHKLVRWLSDTVGVKTKGGDAVDSEVFGTVPGINLGPPKQLIVVTPTFNRPFQAAYLVRLAAALRLVRPPVLWILVEVGLQSEVTARLLRRTGLMYRHLVAPEGTGRPKDRGVSQRNFALEHIERHRLDGIVYFADDDNAYSSQVFEEVRKVQRVGVLPVAMLAEGISHIPLEGPVCERGRVVGWHTTQQSAKMRRYHVDFVSLAFNSSLLWTPPERPNSRRTGPLRIRDNVREGFQETTFLEQLVVDENDLEGLAGDCRQLLTWHQHSEAPPNSHYPPFWVLPLDLAPTVTASTGEATA